MAVNFLVGYSSFAEVRRGNICYVDKTSILEKLLSPLPPKVTLFTRPRRFGKTLTMSMMAEFFDITKESGDLFNGLKISGNRALCDQWMNQYPVLFMSFKEIAGRHFEAALSRFRTVIRNTCKQLGYLRESDKVFKEDRDRLTAISDRKADDSELHNDLVTLTSALATHHGKPVILLIDEYDVPVANAWKNGYYEEMIEFMRSFLGAALKDSGSLTFAVLTGCLRITKESLFTGLNNLKCFGIDGDSYADMFGFTGAEVDALLAEAGLSDRKDVVREWYDGYCFGNTRDIYCPWSILNYMDDIQRNPDNPPAPRAYWVHTSANELTGGFARKLSSGSVPGDRNARDTVEEVRDRVTRLWAGASIAVRLNEAPSYPTLYANVNNFWTLLYMTGYLTKARDAENCIDNPRADQTVLIIPNREVREAFRQEIIDLWFEREPSDPDQNRFYEAFWNADAEQCAELLDKFLLRTVSWHDTRDRGEPETFWHGILLGLFAMVHFDVHSNREEGEGRYDLSVTEPSLSRGAILEVKRTDTVEKLDSVAEAGLNQIAEKRYDSRLRLEGYRTILHWSMAFCGKRCLARARLIDIDIDDLVNNPTARVPVCLCLDVSGSMGGDPIQELNNAVKEFYNAIMEDETARYAADICIVTFGGDEAQCISDFSSIQSESDLPVLSATDLTPMGEAVNLGLDLLEERINKYKNAGIDYYQPWLVLMTDGAPTDKIEELAKAIGRTVEMVSKKKLTVFPIGIGDDADMKVLAKFSPKRAPLKLQGLKFREFFQWLSQSVSRTSQSIPGENVPLDVDGIKGWGEL